MLQEAFQPEAMILVKQPLRERPKGIGEIWLIGDEMTKDLKLKTSPAGRLAMCSTCWWKLGNGVNGKTFAEASRNITSNFGSTESGEGRHTWKYMVAFTPNL